MFLVGLLALPGAVNAHQKEQLAECRALEDDVERLACYDRVVSGTDASPEVAATSAAGSSTVPLDDEIGKESLGFGAQGNEDKPVVLGRVVDCEGDSRSKYLFYFDNGQVWKQTTSARIRWKDCDFEVNIEKDAFGYKMNRVGEKKTVRILRIK